MKQNSTSLTRKRPVYNLVLAAMFLALGIILPFFTGQIPQIGNMLLPMHLPVFLCGLICGWPYGLAVGLVLPLLRHLLFASECRRWWPLWPWPLSWRPMAVSSDSYMAVLAGNVS